MSLATPYADATVESTLSLAEADGLDLMAAELKAGVNQDSCPSCHSGFDWSFGRSAAYTLGGAVQAG
ncbi:hypothetical protein ACIRBX_01610 [Kitasatospora sp. NPDC096147]|uniref:hypothetical protein n=1 Tax=Kitasatospora sp. NPDC096147 TaxID=3364093 RepID=UPI0038013DEF